VLLPLELVQVGELVKSWCVALLCLLVAHVLLALRSECVPSARQEEPDECPAAPFEEIAPGLVLLDGPAQGSLALVLLERLNARQECQSLPLQLLVAVSLVVPKLYVGSRSP